MSVSTAWDAALEEGERRGEARGELIRSHNLLLRLGRRQFGSADSATESELKSIRDLDRLERLADAILTARSWSELLATP